MGPGTLSRALPDTAVDVTGDDPQDRSHGVDEPPSKLRRRLQRIGVYFLAGVLGLFLLYLVVWSISWLLVRPRDDLAFFEPRPGENTPLVFAHQGGEGIRPSNTMIAFRDSVAIGADVLDADVHMTSDGVLVLIHDESVDRTSNGTGAVRDLTLGELRALDFGYDFSTDGGATFPYRGQGHGIVTVDELFSEFPELRFGLEIKRSAAADAPGELCDLIQAHGYEDQVLVSTYSQESMSVFRRACPSVATSATEDEARRFFIFQLIRLSGFYSPPFDVLQVPEYRSGYHVLTGSFVRAAHRWNVPVVPWTINETDDLERIIGDFDIDGVNTDHPDRMVAVLNGT